jgi:hypothetical protein
MIKSREGNVLRMEMRIAYKILVGKSEGSGSLGKSKR